VSIVTYRSAEVIEPCLRNLFGATSRPLEVVVFDNASDDDTLARLAPFADAVRQVRHPRNIGFGQGHNRVLAGVEADFLLLLNPDVELPRGGLDRLVDYLDRHPECGSVAPVLADGPDGKLGGYGMAYPGQNLLPRSWRDLPGKIAMLQGACMLVRTGLLRQLGGFDQRFFLYAEDVDLSLRIRRAGYTLGCESSVVARHMGGHSERGRSAQSVARRKYAALLQFYDKNYPRNAVNRMLTRDLLRFCFRWLVRSMMPGKASGEKASEYLGRLEAWADFTSLWIDSPDRRPRGLSVWAATGWLTQPERDWAP